MVEGIDDGKDVAQKLLLAPVMEYTIKKDIVCSVMK